MTGVSPVQSQAEALSLAPAGLKAYAALETLPDDILTHVLDELDLGTLARLEGVSRAISEKIHALGWPSYVLRHPISHVSLEPSSISWPASILARHNTFIERSVRRRRWHAVQVGQTWNQPAIPVMKVAADRMVLGVGGKLVVHPFDPPLSRGQNQVGQRRGGKVIGPPREYALARRDQGSGADIMGIIPLSGGQYGVGQYDGTLQRISLPDLPSSNGARPGGGGAVRSTAHYPHPKGSNLHTLTATGTPEDDLMMSSTSAGLISIFNARSPWLSPGTFELPSTTRAWSSLLTSPTSSNGFNALIGTGSGISIYTLHPSGSSASPNTTQPIRYLFGPEAPASSSAYSLTLPPSPSTASRSITHHPSTLLSSWYDSHLRLHDLRSRSTSPVASFSDPYAWADGSAMYCATFLGENWIAGGGARHGAVCIFDVRWPNKGWSAFSPGGKGSPVYALQGDGGRLWGVSEKRAFVLAFDGSADPVYENIRGGVVESGVPVDEYGGQQDPSMVQHGSEGSSVTGMFGEGLIHPHARVRPAKVEERVSGWKGRGGKWSWTVRYRPDDQQSQQSRAAGSQIGSGREWDIGKAGHSVSINDGARPLISGASNDAAAPEPSLPRDAEGKVVGEGVIGYDHADRSVNLFDSVPVPYSPLPAGDHRDDDGSRNRSKGSRGGSRGRGGLRGGYRGRGS